MKIREGRIALLDEDRLVEPTRILLAGDFCPINRTGQAILAGRTTEMVESIGPILEVSDLSIVNLEAPLTSAERGIRKTGPNLRGDPGCVEFLERAGFDVANLANNHIKDFGSAAVLETMDVLERNNIASVGAGGNLEEAAQPLIIERSGRRIAILAYAENEFSIADSVSAGAANLDPVDNLQQIRQVSSENDVTIVLVHGGNEYCPVPSPRMRQWYRAFAEAGASAVVATHTHCPQGMEIVNGAPIVYSMGNFLFDTPYEDSEYAEDDFWWKGYMVRLDFSGKELSAVELVPVSSGPDGSAVKLIEGDEREAFLGYLQHISGIIQDKPELEGLWSAWCLKQGPFWMEYFRKAQYPCTEDEAWMDMMILRNGFTCEAHHEVVKTFLRMICEDRIEAAESFLCELEALQRGHF
jgi:poly-gamma-glutamate synthesis protein (capsule biosynthesis protein)